MAIGERCSTSPPLTIEITLLAYSPVERNHFSTKRIRWQQPGTAEFENSWKKRDKRKADNGRTDELYRYPSISIIVTSKAQHTGHNTVGESRTIKNYHKDRNSGCHHSFSQGYREKIIE
ncbi:hypothetical protein KIN20_001447 [Parelaphostrongylus tenuis]|uniref:Uncharacterized protein n=1 Tax=Parelaphostrongylus tenuis TaxID=148309 RepID=A0AAD5LX03_PARTN|nr:hypothetical protein KIN20_001447 [Parelaphostrongylus tenuis]